MPTYKMTVYVEVFARSEREAYGFVQHACAMAKQQEVVFEEAEITETQLDEEPEGEAWSGGFASNH